MSKEMRRVPARAGRGFVLAELVVVVVIAIIAISIAAVGARQSRLGAGLAGSLSNLKRLGEATGHYGADYDGKFWTFSWSVGNTPTQYPDLQNPGDSVDATAFQATDILRRRFDESMPRLDDRLAPPYLSMLVLADYYDQDLPMEWIVSPGDRIRLRWQADPHNPPDLNEQGGYAWEWHFGVFGSSYLLPPAFYAPGERDDSGQLTIYQHSNHYLYYVPNGVVLGGRSLSEVAHPSAKVHLVERASYFFGPTPMFYMFEVARVPLLMADGSAAPRTTGDANKSFNPNYPDDPERSTKTTYTPNPVYEILTWSHAYTETRYKWTRRALGGVDFNGERAE